MLKYFCFRWALLITLAFTLSSCGGKEKKPEKPDNAETKSSTASPPPEAPTTEAQEPVAAEPELVWSYSGQNGPDHWAQLDPLFNKCETGARQSPIDLKWRKPRKGNTLDFAYKESTLRVIDTGYTVQVNFDPGSYLKIAGQNFALTHLQFHTPSEHSLSGNSLPMEMQFFHKNDKGTVAILSVILIEGPQNDLIEKFWSSLPDVKNKEVSNPRFIFNPNELIPKRLTHYAYMGSLTTPPCSEGVKWYVLNTPMTASRDQILSFRKLYAMNSRPLQPLNGRTVTNY